MAIVYDDVFASETLNRLHRFPAYPICVEVACESGLVAGHHGSQSSKRQHVDSLKSQGCETCRGMALPVR